jgi:hypothetical protein
MHTREQRVHHCGSWKVWCGHSTREQISFLLSLSHSRQFLEMVKINFKDGFRNCYYIIDHQNYICAQKAQICNVVSFTILFFSWEFKPVNSSLAHLPPVTTSNIISRMLFFISTFINLVQNFRLLINDLQSFRSCWVLQFLCIGRLSTRGVKFRNLIFKIWELKTYIWAQKWS